jgi:hypothetical protein
MTTSEHKDPSNLLLIFFFVCFAIILLGIVIFFARDINKDSELKPGSEGHGSMILPQDKEHMYQSRFV